MKIQFSTFYKFYFWFVSGKKKKPICQNVNDEKMESSRSMHAFYLTMNLEYLLPL